jgi:hypothetical protein
MHCPRSCPTSWPGCGLGPTAHRSVGSSMCPGKPLLCPGMMSRLPCCRVCVEVTACATARQAPWAEASSGVWTAQQDCSATTPGGFACAEAARRLHKAAGVLQSHSTRSQACPHAWVAWVPQQRPAAGQLTESVMSTPRCSMHGVGSMCLQLQASRLRGRQKPPHVEPVHSGVAQLSQAVAALGAAPQCTTGMGLARKGMKKGSCTAPHSLRRVGLCMHCMLPVSSRRSSVKYATCGRAAGIDS